MKRWTLIPLMCVGVLMACNPKHEHDHGAAGAASQGALSSPAGLAVEVRDAWARPTVGGQSASGAYMHITARQDVVLLGASTPVAGITEIHEMKMDGDVMRMRSMDTLPIKSGDSVELKPGGYHVMLMDLQGPLAEGKAFEITLDVQLADKSTVKVPVQTVVKPMAASGGGHAHH